MISLIFILKLIIAFVGVVLIFSAIFLYENEEGIVQSHLEKAWIHIDDLQRRALTRHTAFMIAAATAASGLMNRLFGTKLFTRQAFGMSGWLSLISMCVVVTVYNYLLALLPDLDKLKTESLWLNFVISLGYAILYLFRLIFVMGAPSSWAVSLVVSFVGIVLIYLSLKSDKHRLLLFRTILALFLFLAVMSAIPGWYRPQFLSMIFGVPDIVWMVLCFGIACDFLFVGAIRWLLKWQAEQSSFLDALSIALYQLLFAILLIAGPIYLAFKVKTLGFVFVAMLASVVTNAFTVFASLLFFLTSIALALHKLFWPIVSRGTYALQRLEPFKDSRWRIAMVFSGAFLVGIVLPGALPFVRRIVDVLL